LFGKKVFGNRSDLIARLTGITPSISANKLISRELERNAPAKIKIIDQNEKNSQIRGRKYH
jgi:hypothetical protein